MTNKRERRNKYACNHLVTAVIPTYGKRKEYLQKTVSVVLKNREILLVLVIDNGCTWNVKEFLNSLNDQRVRHIRLESNTGSAGAYHTGIKLASESACNYIWLLDDDNEPSPNCLKTLLSFADYDNHTVLAGCRQRFINPLINNELHFHKYRNSFIGFHIMDIHNKLFKLFHRSTSRCRENECTNITLRMAQYGGLLIPTEVVSRIGLPKKELVLYADDSEYTWRITRSGINIKLVCAATIHDIDDWKMVFNKKFQLLNWLYMENHRAYYDLRNHAWLSYYNISNNKLLFTVNVITFSSLLFFLAVINGKIKIYITIITAIKDGIFSNLGENDKYPLPGN